MNRFHVPPPRLHKTTGLARVRFRGKEYFIGPFDAPDLEDRYQRLIAELMATSGNGRPSVRQRITVADLAGRYLDYARGYYVKHGKTTEEFSTLRRVLEELLPLYGAFPTGQFGPLEFKAARSAFAANGDRSRETVNRMARHVRQMFQWGVEEVLVSEGTWHALLAVKSLRFGRCGLREAEEVQTVEPSVVEATLPYLLPTVAAMVRLQQESSARPGEVCRIRPCDVDQDLQKHEGCWLYQPNQHKSEHHRRQRLIYLGPKAQAVLAPYLHRAPEDYCFSPQHAYREYLERRASSRRTPASCGNRPGKRSGGLAGGPRLNEQYIVDAYRRAIARACRQAGVAVWTPHQIRHTRTTELWLHESPDAARCVAGHSKINTTKIYAHADRVLARRTMAKMG